MENKNNSETNKSENNINTINNDDGDKWGLPLKEVYRLGLKFYKDKTGKAVHLSYEDNVKLIAFTQQAVHGQIDLNTAPPLGVLDVIGKNRRLAWQQLGTISKGQAMEGFLDLLDRLSPLLKPFVEAYKKDKEEKQRMADEAKRKDAEQIEAQRIQSEETKKMESQKNFEEIQRRQLQDALNQQTYHQFKMYAEKQYPGNPEQQAVLIRQLQNEHYHQYMQQLHAQVLNNNNSNTINNNNNNNNSNNNNNNTTNDGNNNLEKLQKECNPSNMNNELSIPTRNVSNDTSDLNVNSNDSLTLMQQTGGDGGGGGGGGGGGDSDTESGEYPVICQANMWTRPDIKQFKQEVSAGKGDGVIRITHGDTVTVRVPTHEGGNCLYWEFATDSYDIGFGVYFEWGKPHTTEVSVHISESDEDDDTLEDDYEEGLNSDDDLESGSIHMPLTGTNAVAASPSSLRNRSILTSIIPIYRRECQNEVYAGSHTYPGEGVYLLKFDNSYSLWRSKTLYYRVFYTR